MTTTPNLDQLTPEQLRTLTESLLVEVQQKDKTILHVKCQNDKLVHEIAILKRHKFARTSEALNSQQRSLLVELVSEDLGAVEATLAKLAQSIPTINLPSSSLNEQRCLQIYRVRLSNMNPTIVIVLAVVSLNGWVKTSAKSWITSPVCLVLSSM